MEKLFIKTGYLFLILDTVYLERYKMQQIKFSSTSEAIQYLSDLTGKRIIVAASREIEKAADRVRFLVKKKGKPYGVAIAQAAKEYGVSTKEVSNQLNPPQKEIKWIKPDFADEAGEYFENDPTRRFFAKMGYSFKTDKELIDFLSNGKLQKISKFGVNPAMNITKDPKDFQEEIQDPTYREGYTQLRDRLNEKIKIELEAPILIKFPKTYYGFSGNRRSNLAWNNDLDVTFWVVEAPDISDKQESLF